MSSIVPCACVFVVAGCVMIGIGVSGVMDDPSIVQDGGPMMLLLISGCVTVLMCGGAALMDLCRQKIWLNRRIPTDSFDRVDTSQPVKSISVNDFV